MAAQKAAAITAEATTVPTSAAAAFASHTFARRGSNSSWLLIEPVAQSAPAKVVPAITMIPASITSIARPASWATSSRTSGRRGRYHSTCGVIDSAQSSAVAPGPLYSSGRFSQRASSRLNSGEEMSRWTCASARARSAAPTGLVSHTVLTAMRVVSRTAASRVSAIARRERNRVSSTRKSLTAHLPRWSRPW
jgi:hypothetical protein